MGKKFLTLRKRRKNERSVLAAKKDLLRRPALRKYGSRNELQNVKNDSCDNIKENSNSNCEEHSDCDDIEESNNSDCDSVEQCNESISELSDCHSLHSEAVNEVHQNSTSPIGLDPDCCRRSLVDLDQIDWKFSFHSSELPDIDCIGIDTGGLMTIHPVSDPFHYMSMPVLSAFGLIFESTLEELQYSYMNLIQSINSAGRWFMLPSNNRTPLYTIQLCTYEVNSVSAPVITLTVEIHYSHCWYLRHSMGVVMRHQHPVLVTLPVYLYTGHDIKLVTDAIDNCHRCKGIEDPRFFPLIVKNKGRFYDFQGM